MIKQIWLRIIALLALAVVPVILLQLKLQEESVTLVFEMADKTEARAMVDDVLQHLRAEAKRYPEREEEFKAKFLQISDSKRSLEGFFLAKESIYQNIRYQTLILSVIVLIVSLLGSLLISRGIVRRVKALIHEREKTARKLRDLKSLENWQNVAKTLVHELRAPMTPIKLIASDLDFKRRSLPPASFDAYLRDAQNLMTEQIEAIESMIEGFTIFGKLPLPQLQSTSIHALLKNFVENYQRAFGQSVELGVEFHSPDRERSLDAKLLRDLLFNLCKNASEANDSKTTITITYERSLGSDRIVVHNSGRSVPDSVAKSLFDPYVSTKGGQNLGLGLAISRKIALDHNGDLSLLKVASGVSFLIDLPLEDTQERKL